MRIISGTARGRKLNILEGKHTRPTSEKVKEAMFSIIQFDIEGRRVLDLFAGSGQLGLEALSRGARECVFVDNSREALEVVRENVERCRFLESSKLVLSDYSTFFKTHKEGFDIIVADPPYEVKNYMGILDMISGFDMLNNNGIIMIESLVESQLPEQVGSLKRGREYNYGKTKLTLYAHAQESVE